MDINELESFKLSDAVKFHKELNPRLWQDEKLDPEVRDQLMLIAEDFVEYLGLDNLKVEDVTISGSNAAYSYTPHSDLDLHILVDFNKLPDNPVYQELFTAKKTLYNDQHDISVHGVPVELYVQDVNQPVQSLGEYSIVHDKWIRIPKKRRANFDEAATKAKYEKLGDLIELALKTKDPKRVTDTIALVKRYRKSGLDKHGEFGPENLAYKAVRKQGLVQALYDLKSELHGEKLSIEEAASRDDALIKIKKLLQTAGRTPAEKENIKRIVAKMMQQWNIDPNEIGIRQKVDPVKAKIAKAAYEKTMAADKFKQEWNRFKQGIFAEDRSFQPQSNPLEKLVQEYSYFTSLGNVHLDKQGETPDARQQLLSLVQRLNKDGKTFANLDKSKLEANRDIILNHIHQMMTYAIPILKKYLPADKFDAKRNQINSVLTAYNNARQINEEQLDETVHESQLVNLISKRAAEEIFKMLRKKESTLANLIAPDMKRSNLQVWGISAEKLGVPYVNDPVLGSVLHHAKFRASNYVDPINRKRIASYDPKTHDITVHYPAIVRDAKDLGYETQEFLAKVIAHELQHAVDNFKSRGKTFDTKKKSYATLPYEINARFQEALMNITMAFDDAKKKGKVPDRKSLPAFIDSAFKHNNISEFLPKDGKRYKRLAARAYKFFDAELNNPKKEQPLSIVKRAMNYILDKPTSTINEAADYKEYENAIEDFVQSLNPDDVGVEQIGPYHVHFEGFTDDCQEHARERCELPSSDPRHLATYDDVYKEVISDFVRREGGKKPVKVGFAGYEDYPVIYAVFHNPEPYKNPDAWNPFNVNEASGYIPSEKEKNDPRFKTALTVDVKPDAIKKNAKAFGFKTSRAGIPPQARADGKIAEDLMRKYKEFLGEQQEELFPGYDEQHREKRLGDWLQHTHAWDGHKPIVFYHATTKDFDTFNTHGTGFASALGMAFEVERHGSFFAVDPKFAESFIEDPNTGQFKEGGRVLPVYLSVQNPIDLRDNNLSYMLRDDETVEGFKANDIDLRSIYYHIGEYERWELFDGPEGAEFVENLQKLGFDGAIINEAVPNNSNARSGEVWVVFNPNQVKSIRNRGSFSPDDPRLMKESSEPKIDAHRVGDTIWINYFEVPVKGKGLGRAEYEKFEKNLPKDIKKIRLVASDAGYGPTHDFWDRMGFDYAYPDDDNEMVKILKRG